MTWTQRLILEGGYPDGLWACAGCKARFTAGADGNGTNLVHAGDCPEVAVIAAAERDRITALVAAWTPPCGSPDCEAWSTRDQIAAMIRDSG